jgi:hypothetical protein
MNSDYWAGVRFAMHPGLKSDVAGCPESGQERTHALQHDKTVKSGHRPADTPIVAPQS